MRRRPAVKLALPLAAGALLWPVGLVRADVSPTPTPRSCATLELDPIHATFFQSLFATHYDVDGCAPRNARYLTFDWSLQPPTADPGCNHFASDVTVDIFGFDDGDPDEAAWAHGDQDGCNHNVQTVQGHPGTVTVVVADGEATCTASYFGTITGTGNPSACTRTTSGQTATAKAPGTSQTAPGSGFAWWWLLALLAIAMGILSIVFVRRWGGPGGSTYPE